MDKSYTPRLEHKNPDTPQALLQPFSLEHCGVIKVKGKSEMSTWFLNKSDQN